LVTFNDNIAGVTSRTFLRIRRLKSRESIVKERPYLSRVTPSEQILMLVGLWAPIYDSFQFTQLSIDPSSTPPTHSAMRTALGRVGLGVTKAHQKGELEF
jgi:hypothetical protein